MAQIARSAKWRVWHRWLSLVFGIQMVLWAISGAYMVFFDIDYIHGDHLVSASQSPIGKSAPVAPIDAVLARYPTTHSLSLETRWLNGASVPVYVLEGPDGDRLADASSLSPIALDKADITALARHYYAASEAAIDSVSYLTDNAPSEISPHILPVWQVNFDDFGHSSFYLSDTTGALLVKRHRFWRGFDFVWMLHIMDYETRADIETWWLKGFIAGTLVLMITGCVLLVYTLRMKSVSQDSAL